MTFKKYHIQRFDLYLASKFESLGSWIARSPGTFILFPILFTLLMGSGMQQFNYSSDIFYLFVPVNAKSIDDVEVIRSLFPRNVSRYVQGSELGINQFMEVILEPKYDDTVLNLPVWEDALFIVNTVKKLKVYYQGHQYSHDDLCLMFDGKCVGNMFLDLLQSNNVSNMLSHIKYPIMKDPHNDHIFYPMMVHFGGVEENNGFISRAKVMKLIFMFNDATPKMKTVSLMFVNAMQSLLNNLGTPSTTFTIYSPIDLEKELINNIQTAFENYFSIIIMVICAYTIYSCMRTDWVRSKPLMGIIGLLCIILAALSGFGLCLYAGYPWQAINVVVIFLLIGIGMDGVFLLLSAWSRSEQTSRDLVTRMSLTYADTAVSLTITQLTNICSFLVGAVVPGFPCVQIFCIYAAAGLAFCYTYTISTFGAFLALSGHLEHSNRHSLLMTKVKSKSMAEKSSWLYRLLFVGGIDTSDPSNAKDNKDEKMMVFFRNLVAPVLNHGPFKMVILIAFAIYLGFSALGIYNMKEGLQLPNLAMEDSQVVPHFKINDKYFRDFTYRLQVVLPDTLDYFDEEVQKQLFQMIETLENSKYISNNTNFRQFWLTEFLNIAEENFLTFDISTRELFMTNLKLFLEEIRKFSISEDVKLNELGNEIVASRLFLQTTRLQDSQEELRMLLNLREIVAQFPFEVIIFNPLFFIFDQFAQVFDQTILCVSLCVAVMAVIIFIFIPSKICVLWVVFAVLSVEIGVVGMMSFWSINLDVISMIVLTMGIGFSVDFSAHVSYHYLSSDEDHSPEERLAHCLHAVGPPILQGAATTILSVLPLIRHPSYVIITFTKMVILVIFLGLLHGLLLLPVLLTLLGPGSCTRKQRRPKTHSQINILSPIATVSETFIYENGESSTLKQYTMKKAKCVSPNVLKNNLMNAFKETQKDGNSAAAVNNLHLSFFKPNESDTSDNNISVEEHNLKGRGFSDSSYYSYQKRHLRRSGKSVGARYRARAASEGDSIDVQPPLVEDKTRDSFRKKMSALQANIKSFSPLRAANKSKTGTPKVKKGAENVGYDDNDNQTSFTVNDNSINLSTFRPNDSQMNTTINNNTIKEPKLILVDQGPLFSITDAPSEEDESFDKISI